MTGRNHRDRRNGRHLVLLLVAGVLVGCDRAPPATVQNVSTASYRIEIMTPGGFFRAGKNRVRIRLWNDRQLIPITGADLDLALLWIDGRHHMITRSRMPSECLSREIDGFIEFGMDGLWVGSVAVTTPAGPLQQSFRVEVLE